MQTSTGRGANLEGICKSSYATAQHQKVIGLDWRCGKLHWLVVELGHARIKAVLEGLTLDQLCNHCRFGGFGLICRGAAQRISKIS